MEPRANAMAFESLVVSVLASQAGQLCEWARQRCTSLILQCECVGEPQQQRRGPLNTSGCFALLQFRINRNLAERLIR